MVTVITIAELQDQIEKGTAQPLYTVTVAGQQRLYARSASAPMPDKQVWKIVYAVVT